MRNLPSLFILASIISFYSFRNSQATEYTPRHDREIHSRISANRTRFEYAAYALNTVKDVRYTDN